MKPSWRPFSHARHVEAPIFAGSPTVDFSHPDHHRPLDRQAGTTRLEFRAP